MEEPRESLQHVIKALHHTNRAINALIVVVTIQGAAIVWLFISSL